MPNYVAVNVALTIKEHVKITKLAHEKYKGNFSKALRAMLGSDEKEKESCPSCDGTGEIDIKEQMQLKIERLGDILEVDSHRVELTLKDKINEIIDYLNGVLEEKDIVGEM